MLCCWGLSLTKLCNSSSSLLREAARQHQLLLRDHRQSSNQLMSCIVGNVQTKLTRGVKPIIRIRCYELLRTCLMAVSPILSECLRMLSRKSFSCIMAVSRICILSLGMFSAMMEQKRYWPALGRHVSSSCSSVRRAG